MDLTAKSIEEKLMSLLVCKETPNNMKPQNVKEKRQHCYSLSTSVRGETSGAEFWCKSFPE